LRQKNLIFHIKNSTFIVFKFFLYICQPQLDWKDKVATTTKTFPIEFLEHKYGLAENGDKPQQLTVVTK
jgi:hypothetical protein